MTKRTPKAEQTHPVLVRLPVAMADDLASRAKADDLSREQLVRRILREWLDRK